MKKLGLLLLKHLPLGTLAWALFFALIAGSIANWRYGSISNAIDVLQGQPLLIDDNKRLACSTKVGTATDMRLRVRNTLNRPVQIVGAKTSCSCLTMINLPTTVEANSSRELTLNYHGAEQPAEADVSVQLFVDVQSPAIVCFVHATTVSGSTK